MDIRRKVFIFVQISPLAMVNYCTWDRIFKRKRGSIKMFVLLYWYLFNKVDYQAGILKNFENLKQNEKKFEILPKSLDRVQKTSDYIHRMEKSNLIGRDETYKKDEKKHKNIQYLQALSFFYLDPFCIRTPNMKGENIEAHYREYEKNMKILKRPCLSYPVEPMQKIFQEYSTEPEEFMNRILNMKWDYITLYELLQICYFNLYVLFYEALSPDSNRDLNQVDFEIIKFEEAKKLFNSDKTTVIAKYDYFGFVEHQKRLDRGFRSMGLDDLFDLFVTAFLDRIESIILRIKGISDIYRKLERGEISSEEILP